MVLILFCEVRLANKDFKGVLKKCISLYTGKMMHVRRLHCLGHVGHMQVEELPKLLLFT